MKRINSTTGLSLRSALGFSIVELMVVVGIISILGLLAIPQYNRFTAKARQAEARNTLGTIHKLQHAYQLEHERYAEWAIGESYGWRAALNATTGAADCEGEGDYTDHKSKALGLKMDGCAEFRYGYWVVREDEHTDGKEYYHAVAYAPSHSERRIYSDCRGKITTGVTPDRPGGANGVASIGSTTHGDMQGINESKVWAHHKDIIQACE